MSFEEIITEIQLKPELWMSSHPLFKNRITKSKSWKELAERLHIEGKHKQCILLFLNCYKTTHSLLSISGLPEEI